jgi:hypothetical protein
MAEWMPAWHDCMACPLYPVLVARQQLACHQQQHRMMLLSSAAAGSRQQLPAATGWPVTNTEERSSPGTRPTVGRHSSAYLMIVASSSQQCPSRLRHDNGGALGRFSSAYTGSSHPTSVINVCVYPVAYMNVSMSQVAVVYINTPPMARVCCAYICLPNKQ